MKSSVKTALVLDDEAATRHIAEQVLKRNGIAPVGCSNAVAAQQIVQDNQPFNMVITDFQMPDMNGREFVNFLKEHSLWKSVPVIMVSGVISLKHINDLLGNGVDFFLTKPLNVNDLEHYVKQLLRRSAQPQLERGHVRGAPQLMPYLQGTA